MTDTLTTFRIHFVFSDTSDKVKQTRDFQAKTPGQAQQWLRAALAPRKIYIHKIKRVRE